MLELTGAGGLVAVAAAQRRNGWGLVVMLAAAHCLAFSDRLLVAALAPAIKASLSLTDFQLGILQGSGFVLAFAVASLGFAWLGSATRVARAARLRAIVASVLVWSLATALCGVAPSFLVLLAARILLGIGQAALTPAALSLITGVLPAGLTARGVSVYTAGATLGRSIALIGGGAALAYVGLPLLGPDGAWRAVFMLAVAPNLILAAILAALPEPPQPPAAARDASVTLWLRQVWPMLTSLVLVSAATVLVIQTLTAWTTSLLVRQHHLTIAEAGTLFGTIVLVAAPLGHLGGGLLLDGVTASCDRRASHLAAWAPGLVMMAALWLVVPLTALFGLAPGLPVAAAALLALTLVLGVASPAGLAGIQRISPPPLRRRVTAGFLACVTTIGFGLGPASLGLMTDRLFGADGIGSALLVVAVGAALVGTAAALLPLGIAGAAAG